MNTKKTLILALVLAAIAAFVFFWEKPQRAAKEKKELEGDKIVEMKFESVKKIELDRMNEKIVFTKNKEKDSWRIEKPVADEAERWMAQSLISAIQYARPVRTVENVDAESIKKFGLEPPMAVITLENGEVTKHFRIGIKNPVGDTIYVKAEDKNTVYLIAGSTLSALEKPLFEFRRKDLFTSPDPQLKISRLEIVLADEAPIQFIPVAAPKKEEAEERMPRMGEDTTWHLDGPEGPVADAEVMKDLLDKLNTAKITDFIDEPASDLDTYGLTKPRLKITATYGEGEKAQTITLTVGAHREPGANYFAQLSGRQNVIAVHQELLDKFSITRQDLRDHRLVPSLNVERVAIVDLQSPDVSFRISRSAGGWALADETPVEPERVEEILKGIGQIRAETLVDGPRGKRLAGTVRDKEATVLSLFDGDGRVLEIIRFGKAIDPEQVASEKKKAAVAVATVPQSPEKSPETNERSVALVSGGYPGAVYLIKTTALSALPKSVESLKEKPKPAPEADDPQVKMPAGLDMFGGDQ